MVTNEFIFWHLNFILVGDTVSVQSYGNLRKLIYKSMHNILSHPVKYRVIMFILIMSNIFWFSQAAW